MILGMKHLWVRASLIVVIAIIISATLPNNVSAW